MASIRMNPFGPQKIEFGLGHRHGLLEPVHRDPAWLVIVLARYILWGGELIEDHRTDRGMVGNDLLEVLLHGMVAAGQGGMDIPDIPLAAPATSVSSIDRIGVSPTPPLSSTSGRLSWLSRKKSPAGALTRTTKVPAFPAVRA
jgi:hypothetical protein